jgi:hypothetical protein
MHILEYLGEIYLKHIYYQFITSNTRGKIYLFPRGTGKGVALLQVDIRESRVTHLLATDMEDTGQN